MCRIHGRPTEPEGQPQALYVVRASGLKWFRREVAPLLWCIEISAGLGRLWIRLGSYDTDKHPTSAEQMHRLHSAAEERQHMLA